VRVHAVCVLVVGGGPRADSPLCRSLLSGQVTSVEALSGGAADKRPERYPRFKPENIAANAKLVADVVKMAEVRHVHV